MILTFDVFTKKTRLYYISLSISILTLIVIIIGAICNVQLKTIFMPIIDALLIIGSLTMVSFFIIVGSGLVRTYIKDGELVLADDYILIDGNKIPLNDAPSIKLDIGLRTRKRAWYIISNRIEVTDKNGNTYKNRFAIKSYELNEEFEKLLANWQANGVMFSMRYHSVL